MTVVIDGTNGITTPDLESAGPVTGTTATFTGLVTTAGQIKFPATQNASSDTNTLDDYEEGTWTPQVTFGGGSAGVTYSASNGGLYTKVGRLVTVTFILSVTNKGTSTGNFSIPNLPFVGINLSAARGGVAIGYVSGLTVNTPMLMLTAGSTNMDFRNPNGPDMNNTNCATAFDVYGACSYMTN